MYFKLIGSILFLNLIFIKTPAKDFRQALRLQSCINLIFSLAIIVFCFLQKIQVGMWRSLVLKINLKIGLTFITIQNSDFSQTLIPTLFINFSKFKKWANRDLLSII
ncbi:MAG: hypothetical protein ACK5VA_18660, partial [Pseudanabaena sp.]